MQQNYNYKNIQDFNIIKQWYGIIKTGLRMLMKKFTINIVFTDELP